jgi:peptidoglycan hydrolase CwlO-like protein
MLAGWAFAALISLAHANDVSPVEKVITMLEDLQIQVINEGKAESKTYDKFACFCKDMTADKSAQITAGQDQVSDLEAKIGGLNSDRASLDSEVDELNTKILTLSKEIADAKASRKAEHAHYLAVHEEISTALTNAMGAVKEIKARMNAVGGAFISTNDGKRLVAQVKRAALTADSLGLLSKNDQPSQVLSALLQTSAAEPEEYTFQGGEILSMVEDLVQDFKDTKGTVESDEEEAVSVHDALVVSKTKEMNDANDQMNDKKKRSGAKTAKIGTYSGDLTATQAVLTDDQQYIKDLTAKCELKSKEWDQRSQMRQDELTAISTAITIVSGKVKDKTTEKTVRLVQMPRKISTEDSDDDEIDDILETERATNFLQLQKPRHRMAQISARVQAADISEVERALVEQGSPAGDLRTKVVALLKARAMELKSNTLAMLAGKAAADPFVKIKKLIQELIERLLQEAADEANHKGWCDKETGKAKQSRDTKAEAVKDLNAALSENEGKRDKLTEEIQVLTIELAELTDSLAKVTKERKDESVENEATISEAEEGKEAVEQAIDVLSKFYKTAAKAAFTQEDTYASGVDDDAPDTGFSGSNKGSQGAAAGILGMLDVILSDFERTITETAKSEKAADKEFLEFETTTKVSIGTKTVAKDTNEAELQETEQSLREDKESMVEQQELMDAAIKELQELQPACVQTAMSYEERVQKREQEIEALKDALCVLGMEGPVQTEQGCEVKQAS